MSGVNLPPNGFLVNWNAQTSLAHFEEEKTFFASMYVVIDIGTRRRMKRRRSRLELARRRSSLGRVIRRLQVSENNLRKNKNA